MTELVLGTAQLGAGYGITNAVGRLSDRDAGELLSIALASGIRTFDTAAVYDDAEERLGHLMPRRPDVRYVTKFELGAGESPTPARLYGESLARLRVTELDGVLARGIEKLEPQRTAEIARILSDAVAAGAVGRFGASIYDGEELRRAVDLLPGLGIVQVPGSVVDRRLLDDPLLAELHSAGVVVHVRSAFLQGLLLSDPATLPPRFAALAPRIAALDEAAADRGTTRIALLLAALRDHPEVDAVVVGATGAGELAAIVAAWESGDQVAPSAEESLPDALVDPRRWNDPL
jgi:aryl-alcohol dehydrogenase-like predicted oxidoreductase